jgi:hypothetical protein
MTDKNEIMQTYSFTYTDCDGKKYEKIITTPGCTWLECMNDYVRFLESIFQYNIMDKVRIEEPVWMKSMYKHHSDYIDPWTGEYFVDKEEVEATEEDNEGYSEL